MWRFPVFTALIALLCYVGAASTPCARIHIERAPGSAAASEPHCEGDEAGVCQFFQPPCPCGCEHGPAPSVASGGVGAGLMHTDAYPDVAQRFVLEPGRAWRLPGEPVSELDPVPI